MKAIKSLSTSIIVTLGLAASAINGAAWAAATTQHHKIAPKHLYMNALIPITKANPARHVIQQNPATLVMQPFANAVVQPENTPREIGKLLQQLRSRAV
jgi:hypothetical protein